MGVILEEGIGHGGCTTEEEYAEIEKHKNDPPRPSNSIDLSPALKEIKEIRQKVSRSEPSPQTWNNAVEDAKVIRSNALENAKSALEEAFTPALQKIQAKSSPAENAKPHGGISIMIEGNTMHLNENEVKLMEAAIAENKKILSNKKVSVGDTFKSVGDLANKLESESDKNISADDIDGLIGELEEENGKKDIVNNNYKETKKLIDNFREKVAKYPKYISYDGSTVLCVLISVNMSNDISLKGLPLEDRNLILSLLPDNTENKHNAHISVAFDADHDFILTYQGKDDNQQTTINLFNTVIHPNPVSVNIDVPVPVVKDKEKIFVGGGGNIILDKTRIPKLIGVEPHKNNTNEEYTPRRQPVVGRNAYEIREDIMGMALEYSLSNKNKMTPEEIVDVAKTFYSFVENKRR